MDETLPRKCATNSMETNRTIMLRRGHLGFWPADHIADPAAWRAARGISDAQHLAMLTGSMFGFDVPGAHAAAYTGVPKAPRLQRHQKA
jgi:hypothetical protein